MSAKYPQNPFERFADDAIVHCRTSKECGLELHPEKTKIAYCTDEDRRRKYPNEKFDFLGYTFGREGRRIGKNFMNFSPAVKPFGWRFEAGTCICAATSRIEDLARMFNPVIRGWLQYYGRFYRSALYPPMRQLVGHWPDGLIGNTKSCADICAGRRIGWRGYPVAIRNCGRTGRWACGVAPWREPYELRGSSTVLREPRGEIPRGYSPCAGLPVPR